MKEELGLKITIELDLEDNASDIAFYGKLQRLHLYEEALEEINKIAYANVYDEIHCDPVPALKRILSISGKQLAD